MPKTRKTTTQKPQTQQPPSPGTTPEPVIAKPKKPAKIDLVLSMLAAPDGASIPDLMEATGWQAHSVRGALAGTIKKKLGRHVHSEKTDRGRIYHIAPTDQPAETSQGGEAA